VERAVVRRSVIVLALGGSFGLIMRSGLPVCPLAGVFGIPCPGCGLTRATLAFVRGDLRQAFTFHPLVLVLAPLFIWAMSGAAWDYVRGPSPQRTASPWFASRSATVLASLLLVATLSVWGVRFLGYLGGPVPVLTLGEWGRAHGAKLPIATGNASDSPATGTRPAIGGVTR
jgi:hypothetical protein